MVVSGRTSTLPVALTSFVGRESDMAFIRDRLLSGKARLITLIGPGGIGKTRLALEAAHSLADAYSDGTRFVRLETISDPDLVPGILLQAIGARARAIEDVDWWQIRDREHLIIADNLEQIVDGAWCIAEILRNCPRISLIATSRIPLHISGEHEYRLQPPASLAELFRDRVAQVAPHLTFEPEQEQMLDEIVLRLDGLPLAMELAAAQIRTFTLEQIHARLANPLATLKSGPRDAPDRHRALRHTIDWSYQLLTPEMQRRFRQLAIFALNISEEAAAAVWRDEQHTESENTQALDYLLELSEHSLVVHVSGETPSFHLLSTVRAFAEQELQRSGEYADTAQRHAEYFWNLTQMAWPHLDAESSSHWIEVLQRDYENVQKSLNWWTTNPDGFQQQVSCVLALCEFWLRRSLVPEGVGRLQALREHDQFELLPDEFQARIYFQSSWFALRHGEIADFSWFASLAVQRAREAGDRKLLAACLRLLGEVEDRATRYAEAETHVSEAFAIYRELGDVPGMADSLMSLGGLALDMDDTDRAIERFGRAIEAATSTQDLHLSARAYSSASVTRYTRGEYQEALDLARNAFDLNTRTGDLRAMAISHDHLGRYLRALGDLRTSWDHHQQAISLRLGFGELRGVVVWLENCFELLIASQSWRDAAVVLGAADRLREQGSLPLHHHERELRRNAEAPVRANLTPVAFAVAHAHCESWELLDVVAFATAACNRAIAESESSEASPSRVSLTPREREIALLLQQHLSDKEIADQLFISPRTANTHITNIYRKFNVHSRYEFQRVVREQELVSS